MDVLTDLRRGLAAAGTSEVGSGVFAQGIGTSEAQTAVVDGADKQLLRGMGADMASQMTGSGEGLEAVGDGADMLASPLGGFLGLEVVLVGSVMMRGGGEEIGITVLACRGVGLHVAGEFV
jgi:hypothetical protein